MMGKNKSSKGKGKGTSSPTAAPITPVPQAFTLLLNIPGLCQTTGSFFALSASVNCDTSMGTYTAVAYVPGAGPDSSTDNDTSSKGSKGKSKGKGRGN